MSSGGGSKQPTQQTITQSNIPEEFKPYATKMLGEAEALTDIKQNPYVSYGGQRVAGFTPLQQQVQQNMAGMQVRPEMAAASGLTAMAGQQAQRYQNYQPAQGRDFFQTPQMREMGVSYLGTQAPQLEQYQMGPAERARRGIFLPLCNNQGMSDSSDPIKPKSKRGGYRPGAGRKPKVHAPVVIDLGAVAAAAHETTQRRAAAAPQPPEDHQPIAHTKQDEASDEAREFLRAVMREQGLDPKLRIDAAKALLKTAPTSAVGKKEQQQNAALTAHEGTGWDDLLPTVAVQ